MPRSWRRTRRTRKHTTACAGLFTVASARIRADLNANKIDEAGRLLSAFHGVSVDPAAVAALESDIAAARPHALQVQARAAIAKGDAEGATQLISQLAAAGGDRAPQSPTCARRWTRSATRRD